MTGFCFSEEAVAGMWLLNFFHVSQDLYQPMPASCLLQVIKGKLRTTSRIKLIKVEKLTAQLESLDKQV